MRAVRKARLGTEAAQPSIQNARLWAKHVSVLIPEYGFVHAVVTVRWRVLERAAADPLAHVTFGAGCSGLAGRSLKGGA